MKDVIIVGSLFGRHHYGHCYTDVLLPLMLIPQDVWKTAYIVCSPQSPIMTECFRLLGFTESQIIQVVHESEFLYVKHLHTVRKPMSYFCHYGICCTSLRQIFSEKLHLVDLIPSNYFLYNRRPTDTRLFGNFAELVNLTKLKYPDIEWKVFPAIIQTFEETFRLTATAKFFFGATGSSCQKIHAMKPGTVCVIAHSTGYDHATIRPMIALDILCLYYVVPGMKHFINRPVILNLTIATQYIGYGLYALENKQWPKNLPGFKY